VDVKSCKNESTDDLGELINDMKCTAVCSGEKPLRNDRRQRREKRPDIQLYVPKPKQQLQHDPCDSSASSAVSVKSAISDQKKVNTESHKSATASQPQSSADLVSDASKISEHRDKRTYQSKSASAAQQCSSKSAESSASSISSSFCNLSLSATTRTTELEDRNKSVLSGVKQKVKQVKKSQTDEAKHEESDSFISDSVLRKAISYKRVIASDSVRSEKLDWDLGDEFEFSHDGVSWGDVPPPSDHDWSDEENNDDVGTCAMSSTNTQKQKPRRGNHRRGTKKKQAQSTEVLKDGYYAASEQRLTSNSKNSSNYVKAGGFESAKLEKTVVSVSRLPDDCEFPTGGNDVLSKGRGDDEQSLGRVTTKSYSRSCRRKDVEERPRSAAETESQKKSERSEHNDQSHGGRSMVKSSDRQHSNSELKGHNKETNTQQQRPDSGRVGGIIHLPVGVVTTISHDTVRSSVSQVSASARGRNRRPVHDTSGGRALWSPDKLESVSTTQCQGLSAYEQTQLQTSYSTDYAQYYQRQSASQQLYYAEYSPVTGVSQTPPVDSYLYGYPPVTYDGLGYGDDSCYH